MTHTPYTSHKYTIHIRYKWDPFYILIQKLHQSDYIDI